MSLDNIGALFGTDHNVVRSWLDKYTELEPTMPKKIDIINTVETLIQTQQKDFLTLLPNDSVEEKEIEVNNGRN